MLLKGRYVYAHTTPLFIRKKITSSKMRQTKKSKKVPGGVIVDANYTDNALIAP